MPITRHRAQTVVVPRPRMPRPVDAGPEYILYGFLVLIGTGTVLLLLPWATRGEGSTDFVTALFTATSAVCVTGLVVVDTNTHWAPFGQGVILALIQLGGLGFMTSSTLLFVLIGRRLSLRDRVLASESLGPAGATSPAQLVKRIVLATLAIEAVGAGIIMATFLGSDFEARDLWRGLFTAVSAFNNAGFDLEGDFASLTRVRSNELLVGVVCLLVILGGLGYAVWADTVVKRSWRRLTLNTKIVLATTVPLWIIAALVLLASESRLGGIFAESSAGEAVGESLTISVQGRTAGFSVVDMSEMDDSSLLFLSGVMFIGGAPASTAGGIKVVTFTVLLFAIIAAVRGRQRVTAFGREIPPRLVYRALSVALLSVALVFGVAFGLALLEEDKAFIALFFETVSAFATVGLSTGITPEIDDPGRLLLAATMYVGRLGPLTVALALAQRSERERIRYPQEDVSIG